MVTRRASGLTVMTHERETLAAVTARIIVESGLTDWAWARRKATSELGLGAHGVPLPSDDDIINEIKTWQALYGGEAWATQLHEQRHYALVVMQDLEQFAPVLTGPVAEGWAHGGSEIRIEVTAESAKALEIALINLDVEFKPNDHGHGWFSYEVADSDWPLRIAVNEGRAPPDRSRSRVRLSSAALRALLAA